MAGLVLVPDGGRGVEDVGRVVAVVVVAGNQRGRIAVADIPPRRP
jgi:hypothetical protein